MGSETLTTWTCDRCGASVTTTEADTEPEGWRGLVSTHQDDVWLCDACWIDYEAFMDQKGDSGCALDCRGDEHHTHA